MLLRRGLHELKKVKDHISFFDTKGEEDELEAEEVHSLPLNFLSVKDPQKQAMAEVNSHMA